MSWTARRISLAAAAGLLVSAFAVPAVAQWAWRDETGRTVYSDQAPPANIKGDQILRQPSARTFGTTNNATPTAAPDAKGEVKDAAKPPAPKTLAEREMEFRKRLQENAEAEKKRGEDQSRSDERAAECERMRGYLKALEEGQRVARTDAQGNREYLDDAQRAAELSRMRDGLNRSCS